MIRSINSLKLVLRFLLLCFIALSASATAGDSPAFNTPPPYQAKYKAKMYGTSLTLKQELKQLANGQLQISSAAKTFYASFSQRSVFALEQGIPRPVTFDVQKKILSRDRGSYGIQFDVGQAHYKKGNTSVELSVPAGVQDILSVQFMLRNWLPKGETEIEIPVVSKAKLKQYRFKITDEIMLQVPAGRFSAVKVERLDSPEKHDSYWFAKEWGYMLLKMEMPKGKGKIDYLELSSGVVGGRTMMGR